MVQDAAVEGAAFGREMLPRVPVVVVGPPTLLTTSLVTALRAEGFAVKEHEGLLPASAGNGGVLVVKLRVVGAVAQVAEAVRSGWSVLVISLPARPERTAAAIAAGAAVHVPCSAPLDVLIAAATDLAKGGKGMPDEEREKWLEVHRSAQEELEARRRRLDLLTDREFEVLQRLERGQKAADIAARTVLAMSTVRTHIRSILTKLGVHSQEQAIAFYRETRRHAE